MLSLIGSSYFGIFLIVIKNYSSYVDQYLRFFKFNMQAIPSLNSAVINWSLIIFNDDFSSQIQ